MIPIVFIIWILFQIGDNRIRFKFIDLIQTNFHFLLRIWRILIILTQYYLACSIFLILWSEWLFLFWPIWGLALHHAWVLVCVCQRYVVVGWNLLLRLMMLDVHFIKAFEIHFNLINTWNLWSHLKVGHIRGLIKILVLSVLLKALKISISKIFIYIKCYSCKALRMWLASSSISITLNMLDQTSLWCLLIIISSILALLLTLLM